MFAKYLMILRIAGAVPFQSGFQGHKFHPPFASPALGHGPVESAYNLSAGLGVWCEVGTFLFGNNY